VTDRGEEAGSETAGWRREIG